MKNTLIWLVVLVIVIFGGWYIYHKHEAGEYNAPTPAETQTAANLPTIGSPATAADITVTSPSTGTVIASPLSVSGKARGNWFFEASAPVYVIDTSGTIIGRGTIAPQGNAQTTDLVPFKGSISFSTTTATQAGAVVFLNDNPSGQASTSLYTIVPVYFTP